MAGVRMLTEGHQRLVAVEGYFTADVGDEVAALVDELVREGQRRPVIDLTACELINSPGIVALMNLALRVRDDFRGRMILCGVREPTLSILGMVGVLSLVDQAGDRASALDAATAPADG